MLDEGQVKRAAKALILWVNQQDTSNQLLDDDSFISLIITLKKIPEKGRAKPWRIPLVHSLYKDKAICLLTKDPQADFKAKLKADPVEGMEKVIGLTKLRKNYKQYKERRKLLQMYDLFLADDRILSLLPALLGVKFFDKKKQPMPVKISGKSIKADIERARDCTAFFLPAGATCMVKVGRSSFASEQVASNVMSAIGPIVEKIPRKWKNIQAIYMRTHDSPALPIFASLPAMNAIQMGPLRSQKISQTNADPATRKRKRPMAEKAVKKEETQEQEEPKANLLATPKPKKPSSKKAATVRKVKVPSVKKLKKSRPASAKKPKK